MNNPASGISTITDSHVSVSPMVRPKPGSVLRRAAIALTRPPDAFRQSLPLIPVNLIENAAFREMILLRPRPTTENVVDGKEFDLREGIFILLCDLRIARTIGIARGDFLSILCIPVLQIGLRSGSRALFIGNGVDDGERRLGQDRRRRRDDLELVLAEFAERQEGFVLPGDQHI